jgi:anti-anti-sigma factor
VNIEHEIKNNILTIKFDGEFSVFFQDEIEKGIFQKIEEGNYKAILDFSRVNYLDSSGISIIVNTAQRTKSKVAIVGCQPNVKYVLELAEIEELIEYYESVGQAFDALS